MGNVVGNNAIVLTHGMLDSGSAKTAHGLIRGTERFTIKAIIDTKNAGKDAGEVLDGKHRNIPVYASIAEAQKNCTEKIDFCIIGLAFAGGKFPPDIMDILKEAIRGGIGIVNGLHEFLTNMPEYVELAKQHGVSLVDVRKPKIVEEMEYWSGRIHDVPAPRIAVIGTDCALGKRTTARFLMQASRNAGLKAEMIYTGQTGWMQGSKYGFVFDSTLNDFVSGELETAIVNCYNDVKPDVMFLEGQSALRNPLGPCGAEFIVSGGAKHVVLQHSPARQCFKGTTTPLPPLKNEIELIRFYGAETLAVTLNNSDLTLDEARKYQQQFRAELGIPVILPIEDGVDEIITLIKTRILEQKA